MLPTFVIGLREGLEAALIVGIVAAFLRQRGRTDALKQVWLGVGIAVLICAGVGVFLQEANRELPQKQQEQLETVVGLIAVGMVTYMVVWMKRHSRDLKKSLEAATESALDRGTTKALVLMAFLAVLREGFETAVFLLAEFNSTVSTGSAVWGAVLGVAVAVVLGYGIYKGGVTINLSKFFRVTGFVLLLVAAGLLMTAAHTAHEGGWVNFGQDQVVNLNWLARPGTVRYSLVTGVLGIQPDPRTVEVVLYLLYLVPLAVFVTWPQKRRPASAKPVAKSPTPVAA